ncbi:MAG: S41 family peptidase, partial [Chloroflexi bacterium]|nr:S41 family peptidase [Chloroflexota bacterium]
AAAATPEQAEEAFEPFWETWQLLHERYFEQPLDDQQLAEGAIEGMLATLGDPNTRYLSPQAETAERQSFEGEIEGIGAEVTTDETGAIIVVAPFEGSPAEAVGLLPGDILRAADGVELTGLDVGEAASIVRGPAGTTVHLTVQRGDELFELDVVRDIIRVPSVRGEMLEEGIAYLRLSRFANDTAEELHTILEELLAQEPKGLILDLRSNPGGGLGTAVDVADEFLTAGPILVERFGDGREELFEATDEGLAQEIPMVVLIDEGSASASEVLAGAIRDRERGILIGQLSFGKGTVQTWQELTNGGGVRITVARWLTPDGAWVHEQGLTPDFIVALPEPGNEEFNDTQLQAAVDYLLGRPVSVTE